MNEKQKNFITKIHELSDWHYKTVSDEVQKKLEDCGLTKKEMQQVLDSNTISNDKYIFDELVDNLLENEDSSYNIKNLKDDDVVKKR
jgi:hypothetical protein